MSLRWLILLHSMQLREATVLNNIKGVMGIGQATGDKVKVETADGVTTVNGTQSFGIG